MDGSHRRTRTLAAPAGSSHLIEQVGIVQGELEVPAGVLSALEMAFGQAGTPDQLAINYGARSELVDAARARRMDAEPVIRPRRLVVTLKIGEGPPIDRYDELVHCRLLKVLAH